MWSVWLSFCDCAFHSLCPLRVKDKRLMEAFWWERLTWGWGQGDWVLCWWARPCLVNLQSNFLLMGRVVFTDCCLTWDQTTVEAMKIWQPPSKGPMHALPRPSLTHTSARVSWTLTGKSGSVSCGVTAPFSWVLVHTRFCLCPPRVCFPNLVYVL